MRNLVFLAGLALTAIAAIGLPIAVAMSWPRVTTSLLALPGVVAAVVALEIYRRITKNTLRWNRWHTDTAAAIENLNEEVAGVAKRSVDLVDRVTILTKKNVDLSNRMTSLSEKISNSEAVPVRTRLNRALSAGAVKEGGSDHLRMIVQPLLGQARPEDVTPGVMWQTERYGLSVPKALSFHTQIITMSESRKVNSLQPSWLLNTKNAAYGFVDRLNVRRPKSDRIAYPLSQAPVQIPGVIKALHSAGSRGSYLVFSEDRILHVQDGQEFRSLEEFKSHAQSLMAGKAGGRKLRDEWMIEELILEDAENGVPARNLKFYCFYGEVAMMYESRRNPNVEVAIWSADNTMVSTGQDEDKVFDGIGFTPQQKQLVERISLEVPHPFVRIDMLNGEHEIVFGEFTPRPGNFDRFNDHWDRLLGEAWVRAESRLLEDLLNGKRFDRFLDATKMLER